MAHLHPVYDDDPHFSIDPDTREITYQSKENLIIIQGDHNSQRYTFEIPRYIDGHDMILCDSIQVHYINLDTGSGRNRNTGVYKVTDIATSTDDENTLVFSWLISQNATKLVGSLSFVIRFACTSGSKIDYSWNTAVYSSVTIATSVDNAELVVEQYADILESWYMELLMAGTSGVSIVDQAKLEALKSIGDEELVISERIQEYGTTQINAFNSAAETKTAQEIAKIDSEVSKKVSELSVPANIDDGTATGSLNQKFDGGSTLDFTGKNQNAVDAGLLSKLGEVNINNLTRGATGQYATSLGGKSIAKGKRSLAEGTTTIAAGNYSHAEGDNSVALGNDSHAEGYQTTANGNMSHSEGGGTVAQGTYSHAEGSGTKASGAYSHAEGTLTVASGNGAHAGGESTIASGNNSFAFGKQSQATAENAIALGNTAKATAPNTFAEGRETKASGNGSHAEGYQTESAGSNSHAEGYKSKVLSSLAISTGATQPGAGTATPGESGTTFLIDEHKGDNAHVEGWNNRALGFAAHAEGGANNAWGHFSHAEGNGTTTGALVEDSANSEYKINGGTYAHAEGHGTTASGESSHAEGYNTKASGSYSHAEGNGSTASGTASDAGGNNTTASGNMSMAHGDTSSAEGVASDAGGTHTRAVGINSFARGSYTVARKEAQATFGKSVDSGGVSAIGGVFGGHYNQPEANAIFQIGNGTSSERNNAITIYEDGTSNIADVNPNAEGVGKCIVNVNTLKSYTSAVVGRHYEWTNTFDYNKCILAYATINLNIQLNGISRTVAVNVFIPPGNSFIAPSILHFGTVINDLVDNVTHCYAISGAVRTTMNSGNTAFSLSIINSRLLVTTYTENTDTETEVKTKVLSVNSFTTTFKYLTLVEGGTN